MFVVRAFDSRSGIHNRFHHHAQHKAVDLEKNITKVFVSIIEYPINVIIILPYK